MPISPFVDERCTMLGIKVHPPEETDRLHWELTHLWLTEGGNWDDVPGWAKPFQNDHLGGDRHVYMRGRRLNGDWAREPDLFALLWPDDHHFFSPKEEHEWWGNVAINAGFNWSAGDMGPYQGRMNAISSTQVDGLGLPYPPYPWEMNKTFIPETQDVHRWNSHTWIGEQQREIVGAIMGGLHTSFFLVFQEVGAYDPEPPDPPVPPNEQFQRVLNKAEGVADWIAHSDDDKDKAAAAQVYVDIARALIHRGKCTCQ